MSLWLMYEDGHYRVVTEEEYEEKVLESAVLPDCGIPLDLSEPLARDIARVMCGYMARANADVARVSGQHLVSDDAFDEIEAVLVSLHGQPTMETEWQRLEVGGELTI